MEILYINNHLEDTKTAQAYFANKKDVRLVTSGTIGDAIEQLSTRRFSAVICHEDVSGKKVSSYWEELIGLDYYVLGSDSSLFELTHPPRGIYKAPLTEEHLIEILENTQLTIQQPNLKYAETMTDGEPELLVEMLGILKKQLSNAIEKIPYLYKLGDQEELIQVVHKLIGKFSVLAMRDSFSFFILVEKYLREGRELKTYAYNRLLRDLKQGLDFVNEYIETNELYNS